MHKRKVERIIEWYDELDTEIDDIFKQYIRTMGMSYAYGVEKWEIGHSKLIIVQDTSSRGCHDTETHTLPVELLYMESQDRTIAINKIRSDRDEKINKARSDEETRLRELRRLEYEKLQKEFGQ